MEAERKALANKYRSEGAEEAERIQAFADKERTIILANAYRDSEKIRGEGDAISASNYAKAYSRMPTFIHSIVPLSHTRSHSMIRAMFWCLILTPSFFVTSILRTSL